MFVVIPLRFLGVEAFNLPEIVLRFSLLIVWLFFAAVEAMPEILNDNFDVIQGAPFTLSISGCNASCSVILQSAEDPVDAQTLTSKSLLLPIPQIKQSGIGSHAPEIIED